MYKCVCGTKLRFSLAYPRLSIDRLVAVSRFISAFFLNLLCIIFVELELATRISCVSKTLLGWRHRLVYSTYMLPE